MRPLRVLVLGGYGFFGSRLVRRLARQAGLHVLIAGRQREPAEALARTLRAHAQARLEGIALDATAPGLAETLRSIRPDVLVHACGPFQGADYRVPLACIAAGVHCVDLADGRDYVCGIGALHPAARDAGVAIISGASSVPALSSAAADHLAQGLAWVDAIDIGISPGNRTERGLSTVQAVLSYCGQPLPGGRSGRRFGWIGTRSYRYPSPVGRRLLSPCDVPDLSLLPSRYVGSPQVHFGAGLELRWMHRGMNLMALLARAGIVRDWRAHARMLKRAADLFLRLGSDAGAMHVSVQGRNASGDHIERRWQLVATEGDGPFVPTLAAAALVRQFRRELPVAGATACIGLLNLAQFEGELDGLAIRMSSAT